MKILINFEEYLMLIIKGIYLVIRKDVIKLREDCLMFLETKKKLFGFLPKLWKIY